MFSLVLFSLWPSVQITISPTYDRTGDNEWWVDAVEGEHALGESYKS